MASTLLDELPCLLDEADELMARLSCYIRLVVRPSSLSPLVVSNTNNRQQEEEADKMRDHSNSLLELSQILRSIDIPSILQFFAKHLLLTYATTVDKLTAVLPSDPAEREALRTVVAKIFHLMKRMHHWQTATWESLTQFFVCESARRLHWGTHRVLTRLLLQTVVKYVKLHLHWTSYANIAGMVSLHAFFQHQQRMNITTEVNSQLDLAQKPQLFSPLDHIDPQLREYVLCFGTNALVKIQHDFQHHPAAQTIGENLAQLVISCFSSFLACRDLVHLRNQGVFDLETLFTGTISQSTLQSYQDLILYNDVSEWVLFVALCLPHQLINQTASHGRTTSPSVCFWDFVQIVAQDRIVARIHRDQSVNVHDLLYQQLGLSSVSFGPPMNSSSTISGKLGSLKKEMKVLSKQTLRCCGDFHYQRRHFVTWLLRNCCQLLHHNAALVAPLFPMLLAANALGKGEMEWLLVHEAAKSAQTLLPPHIKPKHLHRNHASWILRSDEVSTLIASLHELRLMIQQNHTFVENYYKQYLANGDTDAITYEIQRLDASLMAMLEGFTNKERFIISPLSTSTRVTWCREWHQMNAHFLLSTDESELSIPASLRQRMETACTHVQYLLHHNRLLDQHACFSSCWWFHRAFDAIFHEVIPTTHALNALKMVDIVNHLLSGDYAVDGILEENGMALELTRMQGWLKQMEMTLGHQLEAAMKALVTHQMAMLQEKSSILKGNDRSHDKPTKNSFKQSKRRFSTSDDDTPRVETRTASMTSNPTMKQPHQPSQITSSHSSKTRCGAAEEILLAFAKMMREPCAIVHHTNMHALVLTHFQRCFVQFVRGMIVFKDQTMHVSDRSTALSSSSSSSPPSESLHRSLKDVVVEVQTFFRCTESFFRDQSLSALLVQVLQAESQQTTISRSMATVRPDNTVDWRLIDRLTWLYVALLQRSCAPATNTPAVLASIRHQTFLHSENPEPNALNPIEYTSPEALQHLIELIGPDGVQVIAAAIVEWMATQIKALRWTLEQDQIALIRYGKSFKEPYTDLLAATKQLESLDDMVLQVIRIGNSAFLLQSLWTSTRRSNLQLKQRWEQLLIDKLTDDFDAQNVWSLLPVCFAVSFHAAVWKKSMYYVGADTTNTNVHMCGIGMLVLLRIFRPELPLNKDVMNAKGSSKHRNWIHNDDTGNVKQLELLRFVARLAGQTIWSIRINEKKNESSTSIVVMLTALRFFVEQAPTMTHGDSDPKGTGASMSGILEEFLPEVVLRTIMTPEMGTYHNRENI